METNVLTKEQALVKEIHAAFDEASDTLAARAENALRTDANCLNAFLEKAKLAKKLGFDNCEDVKKADRMMENLKKYRLISEYRNKYPYLKFITEEQLNGLCDKYGLVYAPIANYTGTIPAKKLLEIQNGLRQLEGGNDKPRPVYRYSVTDEVGEGWNFLSDVELNMWDVKKKFDSDARIAKIYETDIVVREIENSDPVIAAPRSQFTGLDNMKEKGFGFFKVTRKVIPDPVVLHPVIGGYLVLAKWGLEANDEALMIPELN